MSTRVVVTGIGMVTPLGLDTPSTWAKLINGESGVDVITQYDPAITETKIAAEVKGFDPAQYIDRKEARHMDRFVQLAVVSAMQAVKHAQLKDVASEEVGVVVGVGLGGISTLLSQQKVLLERGADRVSPFLIPMMIPDMASGQVSIMLGAKGPNFAVSSACSSGSDAIGESYEIIKRGQAVTMITGGAEAVITPIAIAGFNAARALSTSNAEPKKASRPFDAKRDGFVIGEGAAMLVLESLDHARQRGAAILAEVVGYGATSDAFHVTQPAEGGEGGARAMKAALKSAGMKPSQIDYINAHGTSTPLNDKNETMAIKTVFGSDAYRVPISSTKSMTGHLLGAAGAVEAIITLKAVHKNIVPPTMNTDEVEPAWKDKLNLTLGKAQPKEINYAMSNTFGFGGHIATTIFKKYIP